MTDTSLSGRFSESDFRVGRVLNRTSSVLSRNFLPFFVVTALANLPTVLLFKGAETAAPGDTDALIWGVVMMVVSLILVVVLSTLSQAVVLYGAFQDMRGRRVDLKELLQVGLRRFFPILGLAFCMALLGGLGFILLIVPGVILLTMWFVATPVCVVEQLGPIRSMGRSRQLTKGHRWKIFGLMVVLIMVSGIASQTISLALTAMGGAMLGVIGEVLWNGVWGAFYAIAVVVTYHDLRVAKEGIDIEQIAAVFD